MPLKGARKRFAKFRETFAKLSLWVPRGALQSGVEQLPRGGLGGGKGRFEKVPEPPDFRAPEILDPRTPVRRFLRTGVRGSRIFVADALPRTENHSNIHSHGPKTYPTILSHMGRGTQKKHVV